MRYRNILITLNHIELNNRKQKFPNKDSVLNFFKSYFFTLTKVIYIIVSQEKHNDGNIHYHVGLHTTGISDRYFFKKLRELLIEFDGRSFDIQFKKGFNQIANYLLKEDKYPSIFGLSLEELNDLSTSFIKKKSPEYLINKLKEKSTWEDVLTDPDFSQKLLHNYSSLKKLYDVLNNKNQNYIPIIEKYNNGLLKKKTNQYNEQSLTEYIQNIPKYEMDVFNWVLNNVLKKRNFRQDQLLIIGESQTGKSTFVRKLIKDLDLKVYEASSEDFSHYNDKSYDLILIDEFNYKNFNRSFLLKLLDGSSLAYTGKFKEFNIKRDNIAIILICNPSALPDLNNNEWDALKKRLLIVYFVDEKDKTRQITDFSFLDVLSLIEQIGLKQLTINISNNIQINHNFNENS